MNIFKIIWLVLGIISLVLGTIGIVLPILPTVPFYMATVFCFAKSSDRLHSWFISTKLYKNHLEGLAKRKEMTLKAKLSVILSVSLVMGFGFFMMKAVLIGRIILFIVWIAHIFYFIFRIKTIKQEDKEENIGGGKWLKQG